MAGANRGETLASIYDAAFLASALPELYDSNLKMGRRGDPLWRLPKLNEMVQGLRAKLAQLFPKAEELIKATQAVADAFDNAHQPAARASGRSSRSAKSGASNQLRSACERLARSVEALGDTYDAVRDTGRKAGRFAAALAQEAAGVKQVELLSLRAQTANAGEGLGDELKSQLQFAVHALVKEDKDLTQWRKDWAKTWHMWGCEKLWSGLVHRIGDMLCDEAERRRRPRPPEALEDSASSPKQNLFAKKGEFWEIAYEGLQVDAKDRVGMLAIAQLLKNPNTPITMGKLNKMVTGLDLPMSRVSEDSGEAKRQLSDELGTIEVEIAKAKANSDQARIAELTKTGEEYKEDYGRLERNWGNVVDDAARLHDRLRRGIRRSISAITKQHPNLGEHLGKCINTRGAFRYEPRADVHWHTGPEALFVPK